MAKYEPKTKQNSDSVADFLNSISDAKRRSDAQKVMEIMQDITGEKPTMWGKSIVGFGSYHYKYASGQEGDWMKIGFSPRKDSLSLYLMGSYGFVDYKDIMDKLGKFKTGKGCLYIKKLDDVDLDVLKNLIKRSYDDAGRNS